jgi:OmpA-OmpF porin, OOP family
MRRLLIFPLLVVLLSFISSTTCAQGVLDKVKTKVRDKANQRVDQKADEAIDKAMDDGGNSKKENGNKTSSNDSNNKSASDNTDNSDKVAAAAPTIKAYQNYDFVPGDKILFEDTFLDDADGEFPSHWELVSGQGQLNKVKGDKALFLTEGNYVRVKPRMKTDKYLTDPFTIEYDYYPVPGAYGLMTFLKHIDKACDCETDASVNANDNEAAFNGSVSFSKSYAENLSGENFANKWHHIAIAYKNHQLKVYVDQNRVLVVPDTKDDFYAVEFGGLGQEANPLVFRNIRIASGGQMNMIGKKFTESKIVTHGINFDVDKATIKPESMGTLNMIVQVLKDNPDLKFEIDGHTDNSGAAAHNLTLSQQRAIAVKDQLTKMGVDASRLTTKGFGDTKPIADNGTIEGKANNRRVEFVKA